MALPKPMPAPRSLSRTCSTGSARVASRATSDPERIASDRRFRQCTDRSPFQEISVSNRNIPAAIDAPRKESQRVATAHGAGAASSVAAMPGGKPPPTRNAYVPLSGWPSTADVTDQVTV